MYVTLYTFNSFSVKTDIAFVWGFSSVLSVSNTVLYYFEVQTQITVLHNTFNRF